jgi:hypothetical protein
MTDEWMQFALGPIWHGLHSLCWRLLLKLVAGRTGQGTVPQKNTMCAISLPKAVLHLQPYVAWNWQNANRSPAVFAGV